MSYTDKQKKAIDKLEKQLAELKGHNTIHCKTGKHIMTSWVTGGRNGHTIYECKVCDHKIEGWD